MNEDINKNYEDDDNINDQEYEQEFSPDFDENNNEEEIEEYSLDKKNYYQKQNQDETNNENLDEKEKIEDTENINEETKKKGLNTIFTKKAEMNIKKKVVVVFVGTLILLMMFALINAGRDKNDYNPEITGNEEQKENTAEDNTPLSNLENYEQFAKQEKQKQEMLKQQGLKEVKYNELPKEESTENLQKEFTKEDVLGHNQLLEEYYTAKVQEELNSRNSDITFIDVGDNTQNESQSKKENSIDNEIEKMKADVLAKYNMSGNTAQKNKNSGLKEYNSQTLQKSLFTYEIKAEPMK